MGKFLCVLGIFDEETQQVLGEYQRAVLLALKDEGILNEAQYRRAERRLEQSL